MIETCVIFIATALGLFMLVWFPLFFYHFEKIHELLDEIKTILEEWDEE